MDLLLLKKYLWTIFYIRNDLIVHYDQYHTYSRFIQQFIKLIVYLISLKLILIYKKIKTKEKRKFEKKEYDLKLEKNKL